MIGVTGFEPDIPTRRKFSKEGGFEHRLFGVVNNLVNKTTFHQSEISQKQFIISGNNHAARPLQIQKTNRRFPQGTGMRHSGIRKGGIYDEVWRRAGYQEERG